MLAYAGAKVVITWHCCCRCLLLHRPRSSLLLCSDPSIVNFNWQGSLVIRLAAKDSINGLSRKIIIALIGKNRSCPQLLLFHYCLLVIPHDLLGFLFFWDLKGIGSKPDASTPQIANSEYVYIHIHIYIYVNKCISICVYVYMCICKYVSMYLCM